VMALLPARCQSDRKAKESVIIRVFGSSSFNDLIGAKDSVYQRLMLSYATDCLTLSSGGDVIPAELKAA
jgi:hypothetical protein